MSDFNKAKTTTDELLVMIVFNDNGCNYVMSYIGHNSVSKEANCSFALSHIPFSFWRAALHIVYAQRWNKQCFYPLM